MHLSLGHHSDLDNENLDVNEMIVVVDDEDEQGVKKKKRIYRCPECPKRFNKCSNFKQHLGKYYLHELIGFEVFFSICK